jgi:hypothetical protein
MFQKPITKVSEVLEGFCIILVVFLTFKVAMSAANYIL